jgi:hypothetical protein
VTSVRHCRDCDTRVIVARTQAGKYQLLDHVPNHDGNVAAWQDVLGVWRCRTLAEGKPPARAPEKTYMPHAATCTARPDAPQPPLPGVAFLDEWRKARAANAKRKRRRRRQAT